MINVYQLNYKAMGALLGVTGNDVELQIRKYRQAGEQLKQKVEAMKDDAATIAAAAPAPRARAKNSKVKDEEMEDYRMEKPPTSPYLQNG